MMPVRIFVFIFRRVVSYELFVLLIPLRDNIPQNFHHPPVIRRTVYPFEARVCVVIRCMNQSIDRSISWREALCHTAPHHTTSKFNNRAACWKLKSKSLLLRLFSVVDCVALFDWINQSAVALPCCLWSSSFLSSWTDAFVALLSLACCAVNLPLIDCQDSDGGVRVVPLPICIYICIYETNRGGSWRCVTSLSNVYRITDWIIVMHTTHHIYSISHGFDWIGS